MKPEGWYVEFDDPIPLPGGKQLVTLRQAHAFARGREGEAWEWARLYLELAAKRDRAWRWFARRWVYVAIHGEATSAPPAAADKRRKAGWRELRRKAKGKD